MRASWASGFGVEMPAMLPLAFVAEPRTTARIGLPSLTARSWRLIYRQLTASALVCHIGSARIRQSHPASRRARHHCSLGKRESGRRGWVNIEQP